METTKLIPTKSSETIKIPGVIFYVFCLISVQISLQNSLLEDLTDAKPFCHYDDIRTTAEKKFPYR